MVQLLLLALVATLIGAALGWLTQLWLLHALAGFLRADLPPAGWAPVFIGLVVAVAMLAGFALPSLLQLTRVPALRVLRRDVGPPPAALWLALLPALAAIIAVVYGTLGDWTLSLWFVAAVAAMILFLGLGGAVLVQLAGRARRSANLTLRHGLANLARRRSGSIAQIVAFGLGVMLLLVLAILRRDLVTDWRTSLPQGAPNYFFVNIPADQHLQFRSALLAQGARPERMLPMVRGRLVAINGETVPAAASTAGRSPERSARPGGRSRFGGRGGNLADREQNLTWSNELGDDNHIIAGRWWSVADAGQPLVSLASEFQESLGLKLGDRLRFDVAGELIEVSVASFRKVKWDSFRPNFFIVFPPGLLDGAAGSYMTSARYEPRSASDLAALVQRFPSVSVFNIGDLLKQVRSVIDKAVTAVQSVFLFTLLAGLTVLLAAVQASRDERRYETAIMRVLGAGRGMLMRSAVSEFAAIGLLAGLLAASGAALGGFFPGTATRSSLPIQCTHLAGWGSGHAGSREHQWLSRDAAGAQSVATLSAELSLVNDADGNPRLRYRVTVQGYALDRQLIAARAEGRAVERQAQIAIGIAQHVVQYHDPTLIQAIDGDAKQGEFRPRYVDLQIIHLRAAAQHDAVVARGRGTARYQVQIAGAGGRVEGLLGDALLQADDRGVAGAQACGLGQGGDQGSNRQDRYCDQDR